MKNFWASNVFQTLMYGLSKFIISCMCVCVCEGGSRKIQINRQLKHNLINARIVGPQVAQRRHIELRNYVEGISTISLGTYHSSWVWRTSQVARVKEQDKRRSSRLAAWAVLVAVTARCWGGLQGIRLLPAGASDALGERGIWGSGWHQRKLKL